MRHPTVALIVDDDVEFRTVLAEILREEGCRVIEADNGLEALHVLDVMTPDIILLDLIMPSMNGWALSAELEERPELRDVPVVYLSAVARMAPAGGALVLKKPLDLPSLMQLFDAFMHGPAESVVRQRVAPEVREGKEELKGGVVKAGEVKGGARAGRGRG